MKSKIPVSCRYNYLNNDKYCLRTPVVLEHSTTIFGISAAPGGSPSGGPDLFTRSHYLISQWAILGC